MQMETTVLLQATYLTLRSISRIMEPRNIVMEVASISITSQMARKFTSVAFQSTNFRSEGLSPTLLCSTQVTSL